MLCHRQQLYDTYCVLNLAIVLLRNELDSGYNRERVIVAVRLIGSTLSTDTFQKVSEPHNISTVEGAIHERERLIVAVRSLGAYLFI